MTAFPRAIVGLDLGQVSDYTALALLSRVPDPADPRAPATYVGRQLKRWELGTSYPHIVAKVAAFMANPDLRPWHEVRPHRLAPLMRVQADRPVFCIDATGVGRAVVDMFIKPLEALDVEFRPITITGGIGEPREDRWGNTRHRGWWVPKRDLCGAVQAVLQGGRIKFSPGLAEADTLKREMLGFKVKITTHANETFGCDWRDAPNDDILLAVAMALWMGEKGGRLPAGVAYMPAGFDDYRG